MFNRRIKVGGWYVVSTESDEVHVLPKNDIVEHTQDDECICGPKTTYLDKGKLITHASLDGREIEEQRRKR